MRNKFFTPLSRREPARRMPDMRINALKLLHDKNFKFFKKLILKHRVAFTLAIILFVGAYFRLSDFSDLARFNADQVRDAQIVDAMAAGSEFPLLGPKAGGTKFKLGPAFYYLEYISGAFFGTNPAGIAFFVPILAIISIGLLYLLLRRIFATNISLLLAFLYATSFYSIKYSRFAWNPNVIPFFLFAFLLIILAILEKKRGIYPHILLGIIVGIGIQLHTTLLILMPLLSLITYGYLFYKDRRLQWKNMAAAILLMLTLNIPFIASDVMNNGKNLHEFIAGTGTKTSSTSSLAKAVIKDAQFFLQGSTYVISGVEPQSNWSNLSKFSKSRNIKEYFLFIFSLAFFGMGIFASIKRFKKEKEKSKKLILVLLATLPILTFFLFIPIADELNLRFFIILIFLPYLLFGLILEYLSGLKFKKSLFCFVGIVAIAVFSVNFSAYSKTYDLENYRTKESAYGGISIGETREIADFITSESRQIGKQPYMDKFEFSRSLAYFLRQNDTDLQTYSESDFQEGRLVFFAAKKDSAQEIIKKNSRRFELISSLTTGRFFIGAFLSKKIEPLKIGFITDIHGKRSKSSKGDVESTEKRTLQYFTSKMNGDFMPDMVVDNGDTIEGTNRRGQKSIDDFSVLMSYFEKIKAPAYHIIGNHDTRGLSEAEWLALTNQDNSYFYVDAKGFRVLFLNGNDREFKGDDGLYFMSQEQVDWIKDSLENTSAPSIVFIHYPIFQKNVAGGDSIFNLSQSQLLHELFAQNGVLAVFSGHTETLHLEEHDGVRYFVIPGMDRSSKKYVPWYECFAEITASNEVFADLYYKKTVGNGPYQKLRIPSPEFDAIER